MLIQQRPDELSLSGNLKEFIIQSSEQILFILKQGDDIVLSQRYDPGTDGKVSINLRDIIHSRLAFHLIEADYCYKQIDLASVFTADVNGQLITFSVVRGGVDRLADTATNFLTQNFLTWQPNLKAVTYYTPEFLTYYAVSGCYVKLKAYFTNSSKEVIDESVIEYGVLAAGSAYTIPLQYAVIASKLNGRLPAYYDVWIENSSGKSLTYIQRYYASNMLSEQEQWILFENSLGGLDTFRAYGACDFTAEHTHNLAEIEEVSVEYRVDTDRKFQKNTGHLDKKERQWLLDFFPSSKKYIYTGSFLRSIVVVESNVSYTDKELPSNYTFTYQYADAKPLLNLPRTEGLPSVLDIAVPELGSFTVPPRLVEFPRLDLSEGALFPIQNPYSEDWGTTTLGGLVNFVSSWLLQNGNGGGVGHTHHNYDLLQQLSYAMGYLLVASQKIKAGYSDVAGVAQTLKSESFIPGFTGTGGLINEYGDAELNSLIIRRFLQVPELRFNRITITMGDKWRAPGGGLIEAVDTELQIITLKLEQGEYGAVDVGDICMGIFHSEKTDDNATEDTDDSRGNRTFAGFFTAYFTVTEILDSENCQFKYQLRPESDRWRNSFHPCTAMHFVSYGSFSNKDRQTSVYETRTYTRMLWKQNTWEIGAANIAMQLGDLSNMTIHGINMEGHSAYLNNVYFTGSINQIKPDGSAAPIPNLLPDWKPGDTVNFYDEVSHAGGRWLCVNEDGTATIPSKDNPNWFQTVAPGTDGKDGESVTSAPAWRSQDLPYPAKTILSFAEKLWISKRETSEAPYPLHQDQDGNYILQTQDNEATYHYIVYKEIQSEDWDLLLDPKSFLKGVADTDVLYAISDSNTVAPTDGWQTLAPEWTEGKYIWSKTKTTYTDGTSTETVPLCLPTGISGADGVGLKSIVEQYYLSTSQTVLNGGEWSNTRPEWKENRYYWTRSVITFTNNEETTTAEICVSGEKGRDGDSVTSQGEWKTGLNVKYLGTVRMGRATWMCVNPAGTTNPPIWVHTDESGNRILQTQDDGKTYRYTLTDKKNTAEYELVAEDGNDGVNGGEIKQVFQTAATRPATPTGSTIPPTGWSITPTDPTETGYTWMSQATVNGYGEVSTWSMPIRQTGLAGDKGEPGIQGCLLNKAEWRTGVEWRNDEALTSGTRYLDVALIRDDSLTTGWQAYKCLKTHISTAANKPGNTEYWEPFGLNVNAIFTSMIIAKDAILEFVQGNQFLIKDSRGNVIGGFSGEGYIWMGGPSPNTAKNVQRADGSGHLAGGNIFWDENGNVEVAGDFIGKISTRSEGKRMVLDPSKNSFTMYNSQNHPIVSLQFMDNEPSMCGFVARQYSGNTLISRMDVMPSNIYAMSYPEANTSGKTLSMSLTASGLLFMENGTVTKSYPRK